MSFTPKTWKDAPSGWKIGDPIPDDATPLDADGQHDQEQRLAAYTDERADAIETEVDALDTRVTTLEGDTTTINEVPGLQAALDALQSAATAATDAELQDAVDTIDSALSGKQDAATAATDAELASAVATINSALAAKQDAASAATDTELANAVATINTAIALDQPLSQKNQANGYAGLGSDGKVPASLLPAASSNVPLTVSRDGSGLVTGVDGTTTDITSIARTGGRISSYAENGVTRTVSRDGNGRVTGVS